MPRKSAEARGAAACVVRLLQDEPSGSLHAADLIDQIVRGGYEVDQGARTVRSMLNSGEIGFGREMDIRLRSVMAVPVGDRPA
jgi:hypothetical protein